MPWLVVLGTGSWGFVDSERTLRRYPAGVHEVDDEAVEFARRSGNPGLVVTERKPEIVLRELEGPLSPEHLRLPADEAVLLAPTPEKLDAGATEGEHVLPLDYVCPLCPRRLPTQASLARHAEMNHPGTAVDLLMCPSPSHPSPTSSESSD